MVAKIFIDGEAGTTGLQIRERLAGRRDLEVLSIAADKRKDMDERKRLLNAADIAILCLPDDAAKESVSLIENDDDQGDRRLDGASGCRGLGLWLCRDGQGAGGRHCAARSVSPIPDAGRRGRSQR